MKKRVKIALLLILVLLVTIPVAGYIYLEYFFELKLELSLFEPGPIKSVDPLAWQKLKIGMTKQEVIELLGKSDRKSGAATLEVNGKHPTVNREFWLYNWSDGFDFFPNSKAYVIIFDENAKVKMFREPLVTTAPANE